MNWTEVIGEAISYIESHLTEEITLEKIAEHVCVSSFYFQKGFSFACGITVSEYIRNWRMALAGNDLLASDAKVIDIALKYGYSSPTSFNRAFQNVHGITPMLAKNMGCTLSAYPPIKFSIKVTGGEEMSYHIEKKENIRIVGIKTPLTEDLEENMRIVPMFWEQALDNNQISKLSKLSNGKPTGIMGVSVYTNPQDIYYYIAVASDVPIFDDITEFVIPEAMWVVFENDGLFKEDVQSVFHRFLTEFLPFSGYEYAGLPDIEIYPISEGRPTKGHSEVWIAIKKTKES